VQEKEWMYRISVNHNKVPIPTLEKWNHITGAQLHPGLHLIVGYLKVKTALSALATGGGMPAVAATGAGAGAGATISAGGTAGTGAGKAVQTDGGTPAQGSGGTAPAKPLTPASTPAPTPASNAGTVAQTGTPAQADGGIAAQPPAAAKVVDNSAASTQFAPHFNGGVFKSEFSDGGKSATGQAGIFKSSSGWQDGKYYALMNNVAVGTIVRISDPSTGKSVYAKVLGQLPDMKESAGLTVRLSNAAAAELGEGDAARFNVGISY
jgi:hypothetical protein